MGFRTTEQLGFRRRRYNIPSLLFRESWFGKFWVEELQKLPSYTFKRVFSDRGQSLQSSPSDTATSLFLRRFFHRPRFKVSWRKAVPCRHLIYRVALRSHNGGGTLFPSRGIIESYGDTREKSGRLVCGRSSLAEPSRSQP